MPPAKTLKQAKAAFKARDETPITEREAKQLERALQLDRRAWALREREKTRADVTKKRLAQEKAQKDEERRLGTQRRRDRFGFKSSQFHLGAFFQKPGLNVAEGNAVVEGNQSEAVGEMELRDEQGEHAGLVAQHNAADDDEFEDEFEDSIDDESLLEALQSPESVRTIRPAEKSPSNTKSATTTTAAATSMPPPPLPLHKTTTKLSVPVTVQAKVSAPAANPPSLEQEWHSFLSSSTQIARELSDTQEPSPPHRSNPPESTAAASAQEAPRTNSFSSAGSSSSSFDLTEDDLEKLDPTTPSVGAAKRDQERAWMPPPPLPLPLPGGLKQDSRQGPEKEKESDIRKDAPRPAPSAARMNEDFTMTELESFVDEDLELTQAC